MEEVKTKASPPAVSSVQLIKCPGLGHSCPLAPPSGCLSGGIIFFTLIFKTEFNGFTALLLAGMGTVERHLSGIFNNRGH